MATTRLKYGQSFYVVVAGQPPPLGTEYIFLDLAGRSPDRPIRKGSGVKLVRLATGQVEGEFIIDSKVAGDYILADIYPSKGVRVDLRTSSGLSKTIRVSVVQDPDASEPPPVITVGLYNALANGYLSTCDGCSILPGYSVDVHLPTASSLGSLWQLTYLDSGSGQVALLNTLSGTYLSVCSECSGLPGYSVDVHETSITSSSTWTLTTTGGSTYLVSEESSANAWLSVCSGCPKSPTGFSVDVHESSATPSSTWALTIMAAPLGPGSGQPSSTPSAGRWIVWVGVGLWLSGLVISMILTGKHTATRIVGVMMSVIGIGLIFWAGLG